jgi:DNA-binding NarL/FixJ family response regulator
MLFQESGYRPENVADCLDGLARVALAMGDVARAARRLGAAESLRELRGPGTNRRPSARRTTEATIAATRAAMGEERFVATWAAGQAMTLDAAVAESLAETEVALLPTQPPGPPAPGPIVVSAAAPTASGPTMADAEARTVAGLTRREVEILRLIAAGRSNREIADDLALSVRTVERHITNLYTKIDVGGRADATAFVFRHGLA